MEHGEPPGRPQDEHLSPEIQPQGIQQVQKPVRILVSFNHEQSGSQHTHILKRPLEDLMYAATIEQVTHGNNETCRKTLGVLMGPLSKPQNGHINYTVTVAASPDKVDTVLHQIRSAMQELQSRYRSGFSDVFVGLQDIPEASVTSVEGAAVELKHATAHRNGEQGEDDRDLSGTEDLRA